MLKNNISKIANKKFNIPEIDFSFFGTENSDNLNIKYPPITRTTERFEKYKDEIKEFISYMGFSKLTLNQINCPVYGFVMLKPKFLKINKWFQYTNKPEDYEFYFNPRIINVSEIKFSKIEYCSSIPNMTVRIPRYLEISFEYLNCNYEKKFEIAKGFRSRLIQNSIDLCEGNSIFDLSEREKYPFKFYDSKSINKYEKNLFDYIEKIKMKNENFDDEKYDNLLKSAVQKNNQEDNFFM